VAQMTESGVIKPGDFANSKCALVYGQMTEPPGARFARGANGLTVAEYFATSKARTRCCSSTTSSASRRQVLTVSTLLDACLRRGYQPNLATEMGELQERITSTSKGSSPQCRRCTCLPTI